MGVAAALLHLVHGAVTPAMTQALTETEVGAAVTEKVAKSGVTSALVAKFRSMLPKRAPKPIVYLPNPELVRQRLHELTAYPKPFEPGDLPRTVLKLHTHPDTTLHVLAATSPHLFPNSTPAPRSISDGHVPNSSAWPRVVERNQPANYEITGTVDRLPSSPLSDSEVLDRPSWVRLVEPRQPLASTLKPPTKIEFNRTIRGLPLRPVRPPGVDAFTALGIGPTFVEPDFCEVYVITRERDESLLPGADRITAMVDLAFTEEGARRRLLEISGLSEFLIEDLELRSPMMGIAEVLELLRATTNDTFKIEPYETVIARENLSFLYH